MKLGEVAEASVVVVLPVCRAEDRERGVLEASWECRIEGEFGVAVAEKGWERWVVFPGWEPIVGLGRGGVVVAFGDARVLPWKANRWYKEEAILVVADRRRKEVEHEDSFYLVSTDTDSGGGDVDGLKVERGSFEGKGCPGKFSNCCVCS
ncbi:rubisco accumulation factor 1 chloroplastic [Tripterygium wilfordii]|uniref:Rubisco accumulation factor 1 chloroplastic n=1 Tax=Tripterygium wilfordii TaxID=458696 RepID=A0A7J7D2A9_TRIWF|nr:rubisco accumulation factor 1 chloroplastic [Tripterygium wilfordii]